MSKNSVQIDVQDRTADALARHLWIIGVDVDKIF